jgi:hypothetical protein
MVAVRVNGSESALQTTQLSKLAELIELIKSNIDPEHMITSIRLNGRELEEQEWGFNLSQFETAIIEIETDTPTNFVASRIEQAPNVVREMFVMFRDSRKSFQGGDTVGGNQRLIQAVNTSRAFFEWYNSLLHLVPASDRNRYDINPQVDEIADVCRRICQQQLYQSWWALGETVEKELEPKLTSLEDYCRTLRA